MPVRILLSLLLAIAVLAVARPHSAAAADFTPDQKKEVEGIVHDYLQAHPEVLIDAIQAAEDKLKPTPRTRRSSRSPLTATGVRRPAIAGRRQPERRRDAGRVLRLSLPYANRSSRRSKS